jgi:hypothetical protein
MAGDAALTPRPAEERRFAEQLQKILREKLLPEYVIHIGKCLLYKLEVDVNGQLRPSAENLQNPKRGQFAFQTDILIEKSLNNSLAIPLVVVELKFGSFSTHDIITYSSKAIRHKEIYPYLRYGFIIGGSGSLSKKFLTHNQGVDFAMAIPDLHKGKAALVLLVKRQISNAECLVEVMRSERANFSRYETNVEIDRRIGAV